MSRHSDHLLVGREIQFCFEDESVISRLYIEVPIRTISKPTDFLSSLGHATLVHTFKLLAHTSFLDLANFLLLGVFEITLVTKFHQVSRLVDLTLESTEGTLDGFTITNVDLDIHIELCGGSDA